jgi:hypothetical protein
LGKDVKEYGKKFMFDGNDDTCWNSDQGDQQFIIVEFPDPVFVSKVEIKFQGGFAATDCLLLAGMGSGEWSELEHFYPSDVNSLQVFPCDRPTAHKVYKLHFNTSSDFFGRIIVYHLQLLGKRQSS